MNNYDVLVRLERLEKTQALLLRKLEKMLSESNSTKDLLDNSDMMRMFNISERTLAYLRSKHQIEFIKLNGKIYYTREAVNNLIESNTILKN